MADQPISLKSTSIPVRVSSIAGVFFDGILILLVLAGVAARFLWVNWSSGANLHPDEYGLTNTLTQESLPSSLSDYFNTRISPLSPYDKYDINGQKIASGPDNSMRWGQWPQIILRAAAEATGNTGYDELRLMGRGLSAVADTLSLMLLFLIARRLVKPRVALLAVALSSMAVLQIQQSHFMTVDNFAVLFTMLSMYFAVRIVQEPALVRRSAPGDAAADGYRPVRRGWWLYILFGVFFGMALASRINLLPLAGMVIVAAFVSTADLRLHYRHDLDDVLLYTALLLVVSGLAAFITFRLTQPMSFRAETGNTTLLTLHINPTWLENMREASQESNGIGGGPPQEQWANRPVLFFPFENMVLWGLGLPLGAAAWAGVAAAVWQVARRRNWRMHLVPLIWITGYFLFMGTRWVSSIRYFLPIYPFLALYAAWGLAAWWGWAAANGRLRRRVLPGLAAGLVVVGTAAYAYAFVQAVYMHEHTRIQASRWIIHNVPGPFELTVNTLTGPRGEPVGAPDGQVITPGVDFIRDFTVDRTGPLVRVMLPHVTAVDGASPTRLQVVIAQDSFGESPLAQATLAIPFAGADSPRGGPVQASISGATLQPGVQYFLIARALGGAVRVSRTVISNETWDEGLPVPIDGYDPFGDLYTGIDMQIRWSDSLQKRDMMEATLDEADYVILSSQRAIWASDRIPLTYPMTMEYYRALFGGQLGYRLAVHFEAPFKIGPLYISDLAGRVAWGHPPALPLFNYSQIAAEETFSVYDHPPVWIFAKTPQYSPQQVQAVLGSVDLSKVIVQAPKYATSPQQLGIK